eukprot:355115-Chlamydomonas_euryale.AAC.6
MSCKLRATQSRGGVFPCSARLLPSAPPTAARARVIAFGRRNQSKSKKAGGPQEDAPPPSQTSPPPPPSPAAASSPETASSWSAEPGPPGGEVAPGMTREYKAFGMRVIEANDSIKGPEDELDFWESDNFEVCRRDGWQARARGREGEWPEERGDAKP